VTDTPKYAKAIHYANVAGKWINGPNYAILTQSGPNIESNGSSGRGTGHFINASTFVITWKWGPVTGTIDAAGSTIRWSNNTVWRKVQ